MGMGKKIMSVLQASSEENFGLPEIDTEEFTKYLDENDIINSLTKALADLYEVEDKPVNPMRFIIDSMMDKEMRAEIEAQKELLENLKNRVEVLESENAELRQNQNNEDDLPAENVEETDKTEENKS